jgi:putative PIN family toxin of toxin-antitoxin system
MRFAPNAAPAVKLVVDTNLLLSGTLWRGSPARLLNAVLGAPGTLCLSAEIILEFGEVLGRKEFAGRLASLNTSVSDVMQRYQRLGRRVLPAEIPAVPALRDPKDLKILAAAVGAKADAIVTGDSDLLVLKEFAGIPIIRVEEALKRLGLPTE